MSPRTLFLVIVYVSSFLLFCTSYAGNVTTATTVGAWHNGKWHASWYTSYNDVPVGGGRNDGHIVTFSTNSSTRTRPLHVTKTCTLPAVTDGDGYVITPASDYDCSYDTTEQYIDHWYCPVGESFIDPQQNVNPGLAANVYDRNGTLTCMIRDDLSPTIYVGMNDYEDGKWTNSPSVNLDVSIADNPGGLGLKKSWYIINGVKTDIGPNFSLSFTEEGIFHVTIGAEDNSTHLGVDGSVSSVGNIGEQTYTIKIDRSGPVVSALPSTGVTASTWGNIVPNISMVLNDTYKGEDIIIHEFNCSDFITKPSFATWILPVSSNGKISGNCNPTNLSNNCNDLTTFASFSPNQTSCQWKCDDGYTKGNDNICHIDSHQLTCDSNLLPKGSYSYNITANLVSESNDIFSLWTLPIGVGVDGKFTSSYEVSTNAYAPLINNCEYECKGGYHDETGKCVNDVKINCCSQGYLQVSAAGTRVDCTLSINQTNVQCVQSPLCGWKKEVLGEWNNSTNQWDYATSNNGSKPGEAGLAEHCGVVSFANSNGSTCNNYYYLKYVDYDSGAGTILRPDSCIVADVGKYSGQENTQKPCTNKPNNATYTSNGKNNDCSWTCNTNHTKSGGNCNANTKNVSCSSIPANSSWNNVSNITQTWNGSDWAPSSTSIFNETSSSSQCRFQCNLNYTWNGSSCNADTRTNVCNVKPAGTVWNSVSQYEQTWNGSSWVPATDTSTVYDTNSTLTSCKYKCDSTHYWDSASCVPNTKVTSCSSKPFGKTWNTVSSITQTWNGSSWTPSSTSVYNMTPSSTECRYK